MMTEGFDPADWLARWTEAGGGWAGPHLLPLGNDPAVFTELLKELDSENRSTLATHLQERSDA